MSATLRGNARPSRRLAAGHLRAMRAGAGRRLGDDRLARGSTKLSAADPEHRSEAEPLGRLDRLRRASLTTAVGWFLAGGLALWAVVRLAGLERGYPAVALIAYTPYIAVGAVVAGAMLALLRQLPAALLCAACAVALVGFLIPRELPDAPPEPRPRGPELRVLGANLMLGRADVDALAELVVAERIDVICLPELTPSAAAAIAASPLAAQLPYAISVPADGGDGNGLRSRYPLRRLPLAGAAKSNELPMIRAAVRLPGEAGVEVVAIHPRPPVDEANTALNTRYLDALPAANPAGPPALLIGDFNATLDTAALREVLDRGYVDAADARGAGLAPTWPQGRLWPPPVTIDHVLADERIEVVDYATEPLPGSDHRAVVAAVRLPVTGDGTGVR